MSRCQGMAMLVVAAITAFPVTGWAQIEEIVVTTRKKAENLQDVPIAVTAITDLQIQRQGIADLADVVQSDPSVQFDRGFGPSDTRVTIRGLSNTRGRSNVAFLIDGIDVTTENLISAGSGLLANRRLLTDVERIELVKGPQNALFGRAAFAGAISYITKDPSDVFEGNARVDFAQDGFQQVDTSFGGPIWDTLGARVTGFWYNQDGHYTNSLSGDGVGGSNGNGAAGTIVWKPNDIFKLKLRSEYSTEDYQPLANLRIGGGWQDAPGVQLHNYPNGVLQHANDMINRVPRFYDANGAAPGGSTSDEVRLNGIGFARATSSTGILDFGQYCPQGFDNHGNTAPGICLPTTFGNGKGRVIKQSENPLTGQDFDGTDLKTFRFASVAGFDLEKVTITSYTGWTNFNGHDNFDQDWQAETDYKFTPPGGAPQLSFPDTPSPDFYNGRRADQLLSGQVSASDSYIHQFSQELRFASNFDGPVNFTTGALFWDEARSLTDRNAIMSCLPLTKSGIWEGVDSLPVIGFQPGLCDGGTAFDSPDTNGTPDPTVIGWQEYYRQLQPQPGSPWSADTRSWSWYGSVNWKITDQWSLDLEDRWVSENFDLTKPNQSTCTNLASALTIGTAFWQDSETFQALCSWAEITTPVDDLPPGNVITGTDTLRLLQGSVSSHFSTPKVTITWQATPDSMIYAYWAKTEKPAGINQLASGGSATNLAAERFDAEKLTAYELGTKNMFNVRGPLQVNLAAFYQDYTDKQVGTQIIDASGTSQPRVINVPAHVYGAELELVWVPDFVEGLRLNFAYTYLDAQYDHYVDAVTSTLRLAYEGEGGCETLYKDTNNNVINTTGMSDFMFQYLFRPAGADLSLVVPPPGEAPLPADLPRAINVSCGIDLNGKQLERTPKNALATAASYQRPLLDTGLDLLLEMNATWQDKRFLDQGNGLAFDAYWNADLRVGLVHPKYEIIAYVDNVFDDDTLRTGGNGPDFGRQVSELGFTAGLGLTQFFGTLPDPRIFGVRATYRFGKE